MITENKRGEELFFEVYEDFKLSVKKELQKRRKQVRDSYKKSNKKEFKDIVWVDFTYTSPKNNNWYIKTGFSGDVNKPKAINHYHCTTNAGPNGSKLYVIYRGNKSAIHEKGQGGGYVVSIVPHVFKRMRERNPDAFKDIFSNDILCEKIFTLEEEGIYYDFDWKSLSKKEETVQDQILALEKPSWRKEKERVDTIPVVLKTLAGLFLGLATYDRSEVRLITYITESEIINEEELEMITKFLIPTWFCYNFKMHDIEEVKEVYRSLMNYMKDKSDRTVYRLAI